jgi:dynein heavy chain
MRIYDILDEFNHKFDNDTDYNRKWKLFGSPKEIIELIDRQSLYLEKEKDKLIAQMMGDQTAFNADIAQLETTISTLSQYQDINQHEEVAGIVSQAHERLQEYMK